MAFLQAAADWLALKSEIANDPSRLGYAGQPPAATAALLNMPGNLLATPQPWTKPAPLVPIASVLIWAGIADAAMGSVPMATVITTPDTDPLYGVCQTALRMLNGGVSALDVSNASVIALIAGLAAGGKITAAQQASLLALGTTPATRAEDLWGAGTTIQPDDVRYALAQS